jgi:predicted ATPase
VVTGDIVLEKGTHGVAGDTINIAARLSDLGMADDILVGPDTFYQSEGYFDFKEMALAAVKGKSKPIRIYKVIGQKEQPIKIHRLRGFQADLIGRTVELNQLNAAAQKLKEGNGTVFSIYGPAGTGKSRLVKEFKESLNLDEIQWLEDLHWADPSFLELIRRLLSESRDPILFLCIYRPTISLFTGHQISAMAHSYQEIRLQDLSASESQSMVESLLRTDTIPSELQRFLQDKVEGNPFYIEEIINSLIESDTLIRDNGNWKLTREIAEAEVSSTIHGVISGRLDRLEKESKRILQEASVIGRTFFYEILNQVTDLKQQIDQNLRCLERLDLIRARALQPDLEYIFKHALTQEVVYNGLLKKERRAIHERIGLVMEQLFQDRLPEFYETLAYHFKQGQSVYKAVTYLMKAGEKSLKRYAVEEAHHYYQEAFDLLSNRPEKTRDDELSV